IADQFERIHDHRADGIEHRAHSVGCGIGYRIRSVLGLLRRATGNDEERANNQDTRDNSVYFQHEKFSHRSAFEGYGRVGQNRARKHSFAWLGFTIEDKIAELDSRAWFQSVASASPWFTPRNCLSSIFRASGLIVNRSMPIDILPHRTHFIEILLLGREMAHQSHAEDVGQYASGMVARIDLVVHPFYRAVLVD